jgi:hypothetical protein
MFRLRLGFPTCPIIICPYWEHDTDKCKVKDVRHNYFNEAVLNMGYVILPSIENISSNFGIPLIFYKNMSCDSHNNG